MESMKQLMRLKRPLRLCVGFQSRDRDLSSDSWIRTAKLLSRACPRRKCQPGA